MTNTGLPPARARSVLISGIGIAGPSLAWWLKHYGFEPTLVERAPEPRETGYMIDFWGMGYDVVERMGLLPEVIRQGYRIEEVRIVDSAGHRVSGFGTRAFRDTLAGRFTSLPRGILAKLLFDSVSGDVETIFSDSVTGLHNTGDGVEVAFEKGDPRRFDLVVGAGGLHSPVRSLVFGEESRYERNLGFAVAAFNIDGYPHRDEGVYVSYCVPGKQVARYALRDGSTGVLLIWRSDPDATTPHADRAAQEARLVQQFAHMGWECDELLAAIRHAPDLYFDSVKQIRMDHWSRGRVALVGDAAFCPSLLAGEGTSLAIAASYVLAGELKRANGDYSAAFAAYEGRLKKLIEEKQDAATWLGGWFAPKTPFGIHARNLLTRFFNNRLVGRKMVERMLGHGMPLPHY